MSVTLLDGWRNFFWKTRPTPPDYAAARREVRKRGLDPDKIPHDRPSHV